jgi:hypothetical protein
LTYLTTRKSLLAAATLAAIIALPASAKERMLEEMIVVTQKREDSLQGCFYGLLPAIEQAT